MIVATEGSAWTVSAINTCGINAVKKVAPKSFSAVQDDIDMMRRQRTFIAPPTAHKTDDCREGIFPSLEIPSGKSIEPKRISIAPAGNNHPIHASGFFKDHTQPNQTPQNFSRPLRAEDFGGNVDFKELIGNLSVQDNVAIARVDIMSGKINSVFDIIAGLKETAKAQGANTLIINADVANLRLRDILERKYGLVRENNQDIIRIPLIPENNSTPKLK